MHSGKGLASVFQESSASIGEAFILVGGGGEGGAGRWASILWGLDTFLPLNCSNFSLKQCERP